MKRNLPRPPKLNDEWLADLEKRAGEMLDGEYATPEQMQKILDAMEEDDFANLDLREDPASSVYRQAAQTWCLHARRASREARGAELIGAVLLVIVLVLGALLIWR